MNTDTPLTDAAAFVPDMTANEKVVRVEFSRDLERKLQIARAALRLYEYAVVVGGRYAALEALEATKP